MNNTITTHPIGAYCTYFTRLRLGKYGLIRTSKVCSNSILLTTLRGYWCWISLCYFDIFVLLLHSFWYYCTLFWYYCTLYCYYWTLFCYYCTLFWYYYTLFCYYYTLFGIIEHFFATIAHFLDVITQFCIIAVCKLRNFNGGQPNFQQISIHALKFYIV